MGKFFETYKQSIILLMAIVLGAIVGVVWGEGAGVLSPFGDLFLNLLLVVIVPLIFLTITTAISNMKQMDVYKNYDGINKNSNGNALYLVVLEWLEQKI